MSLNIPKVSLIIPVYNTEKFLERALKSVEKQTFKYFETIIINDGSTDKSAEIIERFAQNNENVTVINQKNQGLSAARNAGIKKAKGEYIAFLDSDDFLMPTFLSSLYRLASKNNADIAYCAYKLYYDKSGFNIYMPLTPRSKVYSKRQAFGKLISDITFHHFAWNKLYRRTLFTEHDICFPSMYYEDVSTTPKLFFFANKVVATSRALYIYRRHPSSMIASMTDKKINDFIKSLGIIRNFLEEKNVYKRYKLRFLLYAYRLKIQVFYCIFREHLAKSRFKGFFLNLKKANCSINVFTNKRYRLIDHTIILPSYVKIPYETCQISHDSESNIENMGNN